MHAYARLGGLGRIAHVLDRVTGTQVIVGVLACERFNEPDGRCDADEQLRDTLRASHPSGVTVYPDSNVTSALCLCVMNDEG